jgi:hypothetical protein
VERVIVSADSHVMEPADLWTERVSADLRDIAPQVRKNEDAPGYSFHAPTLPPSTVAGAWAAGLTVTSQEHLEKAGYESARPSGWDRGTAEGPRRRRRARRSAVRDAGMRLYRMTDAALQQEFFRVYNDWLAEFCAYDPQRLHGLGLVSLWDVDAGAELGAARRSA